MYFCGDGQDLGFLGKWPLYVRFALFRILIARSMYIENVAKKLTMHGPLNSLMAKR